MRLYALYRGPVFVVALAWASAGLLACESGDEPRPVSTFPTEDLSLRRISGRVLAGREPVAGALVRVDPSPGYAADARLAALGEESPVARTASTNADGFYRLAFAPLAYDLSIRHDRELLVFKMLGVRNFEAPLPIEAAASGFTARVLPTTDPPPGDGTAVVFFVSGTEARGLERCEGFHEVTFERFDSTVTLYAVQYVASAGLTRPVAMGHADVRVSQGQVVSSQIAVTPLRADLDVVFDATPPEGYALGPLEVAVDFGVRANAMPLAHVAPGAPLAMTFIEGARYTVRGRATRDGATSDTGRTIFDPFLRKASLVLPGPVSAESPIDDDAPSMGKASNTIGPTVLERGGVLAVRLGKGVIEHALVPEQDGGPLVRVATSSRTTTVPDAAALGLSRPTGRYLWTMQHFPTLLAPDRLAGAEGRVTPPSWTSAPRVITLR